MTRKREKRLRAQIDARHAEPGRIPTAPRLPDELVVVSYRHYDPGGQYCLSNCTRDEIREYKDCVRMLTQLTWNQVLLQSGKGQHKAGLAYTPYRDSDLKGASRPATVSPQLQISAVRGSQKMRLFGVRQGTVYYILWYDRTHSIVPDS